MYLIYVSQVVAALQTAIKADDGNDIRNDKLMMMLKASNYMNIYN